MNVQSFHRPDEGYNQVAVVSIENNQEKGKSYVIDLEELSKKMKVNNHVAVLEKDDNLLLVEMKPRQFNLTKTLRNIVFSKGERLRSDRFISLQKPSIFKAEKSPPVMNFFDATGSLDKDLMKSYERRQDFSPNGVFDIMGRGQSYHVEQANDDPATKESEPIKKISADEFAKQVRSNSDYESGTPIRLYACNTGSQEDGFAQQLADELGVEVTAATRPIWAHELEEHYIFGATETTLTAQGVEPNFDDRGEWKTFMPHSQSL